MVRQCLLMIMAMVAPTNLGHTGNELVRTAFEAYRAKPAESHCAASGPGQHVLVTGFGLFEGAPFNISGQVVRALAGASAAPALSDEDAGGRAFNVTLGGRQVCVLELEVKWDLAAAVIVDEMSRFQPDMVLMTGRGSGNGEVSLEAGAVNNAVALGGFGADGEPLGDDNFPVDAVPKIDAPILAGKPSGNFRTADKIRMSWDNQALKPIMAAAVSALGWTVVAADGARPDNDYICNNVSYVTLYAARGERVLLAGGAIDLQLDAPLTGAVVGFMHLPVDAARDARTLRAAGAGIQRLIDASL